MNGELHRATASHVMPRERLMHYMCTITSNNNDDDDDM